MRKSNVKRGRKEGKKERIKERRKEEKEERKKEKGYVEKLVKSRLILLYKNQFPGFDNPLQVGKMPPFG